MADVNPSMFNKRLRFEINQPVNIAGGQGNLDNWTELLTCWGYLEKDSGNRALSEFEIVEDNRYKATCWYQSALFNALNNDAVAKVRVLIEDRKFTISSWEKVKEQRNYLRFKLNEQR